TWTWRAPRTATASCPTSGRAPPAPPPASSWSGCAPEPAEMIDGFVTRRTGPAARLWFAVLGFILCGAAGAAAQVRPDTVPPDTLVLPVPPEQMERDTVPTLEGDALRTDSITPAPTLPPYPEP